MLRRLECSGARRVEDWGWRGGGDGMGVLEGVHGGQWCGNTGEGNIGMGA